MTGKRDFQFSKFCAYGFLKNLRFFEAFLIVFLIERGISYTSIGVLYAVREISANLLEIPSGIAADVLGRRKTLAGSFLLYMASFLIFYLFRNPLLFAVAFIFYGAGEAFRSGTHKGMIADYLKGRGEQALMSAYYGRTRSWSQLGLALSSLAAGFFVFLSGGYDSIFLFSTVPYAINFVLILSYPVNLDNREENASKGKREKVKEVLSETIHSITDRKVFKLINLTALHTAYLKAVKDYIQPVLVALVLTLPLFKEYNTDQRSALLIGVVYFVIYFLTSIASASAGKINPGANLFIPVATLLGGLAAGAAGGLFLMAGYPLLTVFFFLIIHLTENLRKPLMTGYLSEQVNSSILTSVLSVQSQVKTVLTALIALIFGFAADRRGVGEALLFVSAGLILFSVLPLFPKLRKKSIAP
ncbi:MFS transporter [Spirochaeta isovalerica]|uniref:MFS family permease n=1 Tax=Spirochaeta isovalerica TaxID=150 RepID=A0A841RBZ8_9SPIO|nr:MFS transporter [Spirochaeta isovalerica]MBB6480198.1 MFS family permease [Spirochaeta isovalerica]